MDGHLRNRWACTLETFTFFLFLLICSCYILTLTSPYSLLFRGSMSVLAARMFELIIRLKWGVIKKLNNAHKNQRKFIGMKCTKVKRTETPGMSNPKGK